MHFARVPSRTGQGGGSGERVPPEDQAERERMNHSQVINAMGLETVSVSERSGSIILDTCAVK